MCVVLWINVQNTLNNENFLFSTRIHDVDLSFLCAVEK